jgi:hypothetical protein
LSPIGLVEILKTPTPIKAPIMLKSAGRTQREMFVTMDKIGLPNNKEAKKIKLNPIKKKSIECLKNDI